MFGGRPGPGRPGAPIATVRAPRLAFGRVVAHLRPDRRVLLTALSINSVAVLLTMSGPRLLGQATNILFDGVIGARLPADLTKAQAIAHLRATGQGRFAAMITPMNVVPGHGVDWMAFGRAIAMVLLAYAVGSLLSWCQGYLLAGVAQRAVSRLREDVEAKLHAVPLSFVDSQPRGELLSRVTNDIDNIGTTLQQGLSQLLNSVLTVIGVVAIMFWISPLLALLSLLVLPASALVSWLIARKSRGEFNAQWAATGRLNAHVEEVHSGHAVVHLYGAAERMSVEFERRNEELFESSFRAQLLAGLVQPAMAFIGSLHYVAVAVIGGYRVAGGQLLLGDLQAFIQYSRTFTMPLTQIAAQLNLLQSGLASAERVFELLDTPEEVPDPAAVVTAEDAQQIEFRDVDFEYLPGQRVINSFNLVVSAGQTIAIVGPTGAGKTTLVNLLLRFYDVTSGSIRIDDLDIRDLPRHQLRRQFAMVLQDTWLFSGTIRENIAYGRPGASDEEVRSASRSALVDRFVRTLPNGYETRIEEDAENISAGEKQLITIARAFLADPKVLILDEATSNVDTRTEVLVQEAMARLLAGRTSFVIAHRLSTIRGADSILVLEGGRVVEQGPHEELISHSGPYRRLYASQYAATSDV